jgi:hypothetical protein
MTTEMVVSGLLYGRRIPVDAYAEIIATRPLGIWCTAVHQWMESSADPKFINNRQKDSPPQIQLHHGMASSVVYIARRVDGNHLKRYSLVRGIRLDMSLAFYKDVCLYIKSRVSKVNK